MFSSSVQVRRNAFFSLWKESVHPISNLPTDIKCLLYPNLRAGTMLLVEELHLESKEFDSWVLKGKDAVLFEIETGNMYSSWKFDGTSVHAFSVEGHVLLLWVDIEDEDDCTQLLKILAIQLGIAISENRRVSTLRLIVRFGFEKLTESGTYIVASVVGTLITIYGQLIVPFLRNQPDVWDTFGQKIIEGPRLSLFSIALAYLFPIGVQLQATISAQIRVYRRKEAARKQK